MARLSPPRHALHRHIRLLDLRKGDDSPLSTVFLRVLRAVCASPKLSTPRRRRSEPSATSQTPSPQCAATSLSLSPGACRDARVASRHEQKSRPNFEYDALRLVSSTPVMPGMFWSLTTRSQACGFSRNAATRRLAALVNRT